MPTFFLTCWFITSNHIKKSLIMIKTITISFILGVSQCFLVFSQNTKEIKQEIDAYSAKAPFKMPKIVVPEFPDRTFNIKDYGAVSDGQSLCTNAIDSAIKACNASGGGKVIIPPGLWITGPIELRSNVNLHLETGALIRFTADHTKYPIIPTSRSRTNFRVMSPIYGIYLNNVAITGHGVLDGSGDSWRPVKKYKMTSRQWNDLVKSGGVVSPDGSIWWPSKQAMDGAAYLKKLKKLKRQNHQRLTADDLIPARDFLRPYLILIVSSKNILIDGPTLMNSPKFNLYPNSSSNIIIRDVKVVNDWYAQNSDGIDLSACTNTIVYKCTVSTGDDGICMKSSHSRSGGPGLKNIIVADCKVYHAHGGFVIGSNTDGGMQDIFVNNCTFVGTDIGLRIKSRRERGGKVDHVYMSNIFMTDIVNEAILFTTYYENNEVGHSPDNHKITKTTPQFSDFYMSNIYCDHAKTAISVTGLPEMPVKNLYFTDVNIDAQQGTEITDAENIHFKNVKVYPEKGSVNSIRNSKNIEIDHSILPQNADLFMKVEGSKSAGIEISGTDLSRLKNPVKYGDDVPKGSVTIK